MGWLTIVRKAELDRLRKAKEFAEEQNMLAQEKEYAMRTALEDVRKRCDELEEEARKWKEKYAAELESRVKISERLYWVRTEEAEPEENQ